MIVPSWISDDGQITLLHGDCREVMAGMEPESVSCVVTSPPFWGLRKYDCLPSIWGGDPECEHDWGDMLPAHHPGQVEQTKWKNAQAAGHGQTAGSGHLCSLCGAWRGWYGLEPTVAMYVEHTVEVLRAIRRVLRKDGVCWFDLDDSRGAHGSRLPDKKRKNVTTTPGRMAPDIPDKSLCGIPQRVFLAAQEDGWIVRSEIIIPTWMPESARDRPTDACRKVLMLTRNNKRLFWTHDDGRIQYRNEGMPRADYVWRHYKTKREMAKEPPNWRTLKDAEGKRIWARRNLWAGHDYWYDGAAVRVDSVSPEQEAHNHRYAQCYEAYDEMAHLRQPGNENNRGIHSRPGPGGRNLGSVWDDLPPSSYPAEHFATFPVAEPERCITASCPAEVCPKCGKARVRVTETRGGYEGGRADDSVYTGQAYDTPQSVPRGIARNFGWPTAETTGWTSCECGAGYEPGLVLDPFIGTGTTAVAAVKLGRRCIGIDLSEEYLKQAVARLTVGDKGVRQMAAARSDGAEQGVLL